jgi:hypothetical protein
VEAVGVQEVILGFLDTPKRNSLQLFAEAFIA